MTWPFDATLVRSSSGCAQADGLHASTAYLSLLSNVEGSCHPGSDRVRGQSPEREPTG